MAFTLLREESSAARTVARRGYHAVYRQNETNRCPGCGRAHWHVGRFSAECGFCGTALPFAGSEFAVERGLAEH
jgi:hypothetical protein